MNPAQAESSGSSNLGVSSMSEGWSETTVDADVLVIGGGLAACFAAIKAKNANPDLEVVLVDKSYTGKSGCSALAAGIFTLAPDMDNFDSWLPRAWEEIVWNGDYLNDQKWLEFVLHEFHDRLMDLDSWGCPFIKTPDGKFERILVRGSNAKRAIRAVKFVGPSLMEAVRRQNRRSKVKMVDRVMVTDLLLKEGQAVGAVGFDMKGENFHFHIFRARSVVMACGGTYGKASYFGHRGQAGEAYGMMARAGVEMMSFDIISRNQAAIDFDLAGMGTFQGLGARFVNRLDEEFMHHYDPELGNRALKKTQAIAMALEVMEGRGPIYLDMTHFTEDKIESMRENLPLGMLILERAGVLEDNKITRRVEWGPGGPGTVAQGGGARVNLEGETSVPRLFAAGDSAAKMAGGTGETGAGALIWASTSGAQAGRHAALACTKGARLEPARQSVAAARERCRSPLLRSSGIDSQRVLTNTQEVICPWNMLIVKHAKRLEKGIEALELIRTHESPYMWARDLHELRMVHEAESLVLTSILMLRSSLVREESRSELREDFPEQDNLNWLKWVGVKPQEDEFVFHTLDIPIDSYPIRPKREKFLHPAWKAAKREIKSAVS